MRRVLLLATTTGYQTRAFGEAAERAGVELVFATDRCSVLDDPWQDSALPIRFHDEAAAVATIVDAAARQAIDGLLVVGDRPTPIAAKAAGALGITWHAYDAVVAARNKRLTRERLNAGGLPMPWFRAVDASADPAALPAVDFPCVIKPVGLSGSRGVIRADNPEALAAAFSRLQTLLRAPDIRAERTAIHDTLIIEGFIPGREFALEGLMTNGRLTPLAIFDKPDPLDGPFFEETIYVTPSAAAGAVQGEIVREVDRAAAAIGLTHGPVHAECRVNDAGVFVLEVAARPIGGLCARALRFVEAAVTPSGSAAERAEANAISLEELLLLHALGHDVDRFGREPAASGVMMIPIPRRGIFRAVSGIEEARATRHIEDVRITAKADQVLIPLPEGASYLGFLFARAGQSDAVTAALRDAHDRLRFTIEPEVRVLQSVHG